MKRRLGLTASPRLVGGAVVLLAVLGGMSAGLSAQTPKSKAKAKAAKAEPIDAWYRPDESIVKNRARYYVWYDSSGWHVRCCAVRNRVFNGTVTIENGRIKACLPVGLKEKTQKDSWTLSKDRLKVAFTFETSTKSDGVDLVVEGDEGKIKFDLAISPDKQTGAQVFIGRNQQHPPSNPFTLPAIPPRGKQRPR